jgi:type VI secretion system secreted protein Hcp
MAALTSKGGAKMAAVDYFLKLDGIDGESADSKHKNEIDIESWSWGETQSGTFKAGGGGGAGKVVMQDFHFVMKVNKASAKLLQACATGEHIKTGLLTCRKAGKEQQEYLKIKLSDCLVSSFQTGGSEGSDIIPTDQVSLNFAKIEYEYKEQKADGTLGGAVKAMYNLKENVAG